MREIVNLEKMSVLEAMAEMSRGSSMDGYIEMRGRDRTSTLSRADKEKRAKKRSSQKRARKRNRHGK